MNSIIFYSLFYFSIGLFWAKVLESICIKYQVGTGESFSVYEHFIAIVLWPISLGIFVSSILYSFITGGPNEEE